MGEGEEEAEAGGGERVAEGDRAAVDVDLAGVDLQRAGGRHGDAGEGLVDLPQVDVLRAQPLAFEQLARGFRGPQVQGGVGAGDDGPPDHLGERLVARGFVRLAAVVRMPAAAPSESWEALPAVIVPSRVKAAGKEARRSALVSGRTPSSSVSAVERRDLLGQPLSRRGGAGVRLRRERVLVRARDAEARVLGVGQLAHPDVLDRAVEAVMDHHVDHRLVAERAGGADVDGVRRAGHRVEAADEDDGGLALAQHAGGQPDR